MKARLALSLSVLAALAGAEHAGAQAAAGELSASARMAPRLQVEVAHSFVPTVAFSGTDLRGWRPLGGAWRAGSGEYVGSPDGGGDGWLVYDHPYQDFAFTAEFRCTSVCRPGLLLRGEASGDRTTGILYSLAEAGLGVFRVELDARGRELQRTPVVAIPPDYSSYFKFRAEFPGLGNAFGTEYGQPAVAAALRKDGGWNHVEVYMMGNWIRVILNGVEAPSGSIASATVDAFGQLALSAEGTPGSEVRYRAVGIKELDRMPAEPAEITSPRFRKQRLESIFFSEAITAADVDLDGNLDVVSGPFIYLGPDFRVKRQIFIPQAYSPTSYPDPLLASAGDFTGDGYPDLIYGGEPARPGYLYVNPGTAVRRWRKYMVIPSIDNEMAFAEDIDGDGKLEYVYGDGGFVGYAKPGPDPTKMWTFHAVTEKGPWGAVSAHGLGTGDINGDGRKDIIQAYGWWEQPASLAGDPVWSYHPVAFGRGGGSGGARAFVYDVNGDGLNDVVTSLSAHAWGLAWFEQKKIGGAISFERHMIMDDFAAPNNGVAFAALHALALADVDGDGLQDIVTGKRWWGHFGENPIDPDSWGAPVLYWFRLVREGGQVRYIPELINNDSGVGTDMITADLNKDGLPDVMTSTRRGTAIFLSQGGMTSR
jgi:hypothetical protein